MHCSGRRFNLSDNLSEIRFTVQPVSSTAEAIFPLESVLILITSSVTLIKLEWCSWQDVLRMEHSTRRASSPSPMGVGGLVGALGGCGLPCALCGST